MTSLKDILINERKAGRTMDEIAENIANLLNDIEQEESKDEAYFNLINEGLDKLCAAAAMKISDPDLLESFKKGFSAEVIDELITMTISIEQSFKEIANVDFTEEIPVTKKPNKKCVCKKEASSLTDFVEEMLNILEDKNVASIKIK